MQRIPVWGAMNHVEQRISRTNPDRDFIKENISTATQFEAIRVLTSFSTSDAVGVACSYLLAVAEKEPQVIRRVLNERIIREGWTGISLLELLKRVAQ